MGFNERVVGGVYGDAHGSVSVVCADIYELATEQPVAFAISLMSSAFAPELAVSSSTGAPIASSR